jgi:hypothetical protein
MHHTTSAACWIMSPLNLLVCVCVQTLSEPFFTDRKGEIPEGKKGYYTMPIVHCHNGLVTVNYGGEFIQVRQQHAETM